MSYFDFDLFTLYIGINKDSKTFLTKRILLNGRNPGGIKTFLEEASAERWRRRRRRVAGGGW